MKYVTNVSMRCNTKQFKAVEPKLIALGREPQTITDFSAYPYLSAWDCEGYNLITNTPGGISHPHKKFEAWNEDLFLALAAMTDEPKGIVGEHFIRKDALVKKYAEHNKYLKLRPLDGSLVGTSGTLYESLDKYNVRKATVKEIIDFYTKEEKREFITPVAMKCNPFEMGMMQAELEKLGYKRQTPDTPPILSKAEYIATCFSMIPDRYFLKITCSSSSRKDRHVIESYNEKLFLALAAMSKGDKFYPGEYAKCIKSLDVLENGSYCQFESGLIFLPKPEEKFVTVGKNFRKATKEELISHFSESHWKVFIDRREASANIKWTPQSVKLNIDLETSSLFDLKSINPVPGFMRMHKPISSNGHRFHPIFGFIPNETPNYHALTDAMRNAVKPVPKVPAFNHTLKVGDTFPPYLSGKVNFIQSLNNIYDSNKFYLDTNTIWIVKAIISEHGFAYYELELRSEICYSENIYLRVGDVDFAIAQYKKEKKVELELQINRNNDAQINLSWQYDNITKKQEEHRSELRKLHQQQGVIGADKRKLKDENDKLRAELKSL